MKTIAIANQKGGCGKTTVSINLASCLALHGRRTLLVDMDPQGHCGLGLAVPEDQIELSVYDLLTAAEDRPVEFGQITWQISKNFDLAPSTVELSALEQKLAGQPGRENRLRDALGMLNGQYEFCVIDCPPSVGMLTFNALRAATVVLIPVETGYFSLQGLSKQLETIDLLNKQCGQDIVVRVVPNLYDVRTKLGREMLAELRKQFSHAMFKTHINFNTKLKESASLGQAIGEYDPGSTGFRDFSSLATELIELLEPGQSKPQTDLLARAESLTKQAEELLSISSRTLGQEPKSAEKIPAEKKIEIIYGASRTDEGIQFMAHYPAAKEVRVAGDFNNWSPDQTPMNRLDNNGDWQTLVPLGPGRYRYRYVVDGAWQQDPHNDYVESNPYGELNSIIEV